jgi:hypothetical protein
MGWREGKGIGPRKKRVPSKSTKETNQEKEKKVYSVALPPGLAALKESESLQDNDNNEETEKSQGTCTDIILSHTELDDGIKAEDDDTYDPYAENFTFAPDNGTYFLSLFFFFISMFSRSLSLSFFSLILIYNKRIMLETVLFVLS